MKGARARRRHRCSRARRGIGCPIARTCQHSACRRTPGCVAVSLPALRSGSSSLRHGDCASRSYVACGMLSRVVRRTAHVDRPRRANASQRSGRTCCWAASRYPVPSWHISVLSRPLEQSQPDVAEVSAGGRPQFEMRVHAINAASPEEFRGRVTASHVFEDRLHGHDVLGLQHSRGVPFSILNRPSAGRVRAVKVRPDAPEGRMCELAEEGVFHLAVVPRYLASCNKPIERLDGFFDLQGQVFRRRDGLSDARIPLGCDPETRTVHRSEHSLADTIP